MLLSRRSFIGGLTALIAAPAIIRVATLMPIKVHEPLIVPQSILMPPTAHWVSSLNDWGPGSDMQNIVDEAVAYENYWASTLKYPKPA
jgi:hypothetical protein